VTFNLLITPFSGAREIGLNHELIITRGSRWFTFKKDTSIRQHKIIIDLHISDHGIDAQDPKE
jgi:hypothetical protein